MTLWVEYSYRFCVGSLSKYCRPELLCAWVCVGRDIFFNFFLWFHIFTIGHSIGILCYYVSGHFMFDRWTWISCTISTKLNIKCILYIQWNLVMRMSRLSLKICKTTSWKHEESDHVEKYHKCRGKNMNAKIELKTAVVVTIRRSNREGKGENENETGKKRGEYRLASAIVSIKTLNKNDKRFQRDCHK